MLNGVGKQRLTTLPVMSLAYLLALGNVFAGEKQCSMNIEGLSDSIVDVAALNFPKGTYGTCINGQTFQQEALISFKGLGLEQVLCRRTLGRPNTLEPGGSVVHLCAGEA